MGEFLTVFIGRRLAEALERYCSDHGIAKSAAVRIAIARLLISEGYVEARSRPVKG